MKKILLDNKYTTKVKGLIADLYINGNCNFNCEYCATKANKWDCFKPMSFDKAKYIIDCITFLTRTNLLKKSKIFFRFVLFFL